MQIHKSPVHSLLLLELEIHAHNEFEHLEFIVEWDWHGYKDVCKVDSVLVHQQEYPHLN